MNADVDAFCQSCTTCNTSKPSNQQPHGLLHTLDVPSRPWETMGVDFVGPLPESRTLNGSFDMIMVTICHLTSLVHLVPILQTYRAKDIAEVIFDRVYKHHGMPKHIVSDRDTLFTSTFWQTLHSLTGTELRISSSYHPQSDGATERANRTMTQMLRQCVDIDQKNWATKLPAIEFAMNSASSATTGFPPFLLTNGQMPRSMIWDQNTEYPGVRRFAQNMKDAILTAHDAILTARVKQTRMANSRRKESPFVVGDLVYLSTANLSLPKGRARKLSPKFIGPFKILDDYKNNSYKLDLPAELKQRGLHPAFHANLLRIHVPNDDRRFPGRQVHQISSLGNSDEWAVSEILTHHGKGSDAMFKLLWKAGDEAWLPYHEISNLEVLNQYLEAQGVASIKDLPKRVSNDVNIPLNAISRGLDNLFSEIVADAEYLKAHGKAHQNRKASDLSNDKRRRHKSKTNPRKHSPKMSSPAEPNFKTFETFAKTLLDKEWDPDLHRVPHGYAEYAIAVQNPALAPMPPGVPYVTNWINGEPRLALAGRSVKGKREHAKPDSEPYPRKDQRNDYSYRNKSRGRGGGRPPYPGGSHTERSFLKRFDLETETSKVINYPNGDILPNSHQRAEQEELRRMRQESIDMRKANNKFNDAFYGNGSSASESVVGSFDWAPSNQQNAHNSPGASQSASMPTPISNVTTPEPGPSQVNTAVPEASSSKGKAVERSSVEPADDKDNDKDVDVDMAASASVSGGTVNIMLILLIITNSFLIVVEMSNLSITPKV